MQKTLLILLLIGFSAATTVKAQSHKTYESWQEVVGGVMNGEQDAANIVFDLKRQLESSAEWLSE